MSDTERPDDWPESFSLAGESASCAHMMTWDGDLYRCIFECGRAEDKPPQKSIRVHRERNNRQNETDTDREEGRE